MAFLNKIELKTKAPNSIIDMIVNGDNSTVNNIIAENIDVMKSYLFKHYDTDTIFNARNKLRSKVILKHLKTLVITDLFDIRKSELPTSTEKKYEEAMRWLEKVASGNIQPDLPLIQVDDDGDGITENVAFLRLGSRKKYANRL